MVVYLWHRSIMSEKLLIAIFIIEVLPLVSPAVGLSLNLDIHHWKLQIAF